VQDVASAGSALADLRALGVGVALDDFGTGYSSLTLLRELPVTQVKIDRSFVANLGAEHRGDLFITESVIDLARRLGLETVAEGVETPDQLAVLRRLGCDCAQGPLWSGALPADQLGTPLVVPTAASARRRRTLRRREHPQGDVGSNAS
jgi:EAL domain-containing protein (putative c-di-GMP-specific phosphodiesterase class I)